MKVIELLTKHAEFVKANEPNTLKYELQVGNKELIMVER